MKTRYFKKEFDMDKREFILIEIPLSKENWHYVQMDATIRMTFIRHKFNVPKYVIIQETPHLTTFRIVRDDVEESDLLKWYDASLFIASELDIQAKCNSTCMEDDEHWKEYKFEII